MGREEVNKILVEALNEKPDAIIIAWKAGEHIKTSVSVGNALETAFVERVLTTKITELFNQQVKVNE